MARVPQVTRTIKTTEVIVLAVNVETAECENVSFTLPRTYKDEKSILKAIEKVNKNELVKPVQVVHTEIKEELYGMTEAEFVEYARIVDRK